MSRRIATLGLALLTAGLLLAHATVSASTDTPPTVPHLFNVRGTGGCEVHLNIHLSTDAVDPQSALRYEVLINGIPSAGNTLHAVSTGNGDGSLYPVYGLPQGGVQVFTMVALDTAGHASAPSNAVRHNFGGPCA